MCQLFHRHQRNDWNMAIPKGVKIEGKQDERNCVLHFLKNLYMASNKLVACGINTFQWS